MASASSPEPTSHVHASNLSPSRSVLLDSPQNAAKRPKRRHVPERSELLLQIEALERELGGLKSQQATKRDRLGEDQQVEDAVDSEDEEAGDVQALEALLMQMDDGALASLLTNNISSTSLLDTLRPHLYEDRRQVLPPAKSAGIEGTGSGLQMDVETAKLDQGTEGATDEDIAQALKERRTRGEELLRHLDRFSGIHFDKITSTEPKLLERGLLVRSITMKGRLLPGLGDVYIVLDVVEDEDEGEGAGPRVARLEVDVSDEVFRALGEEHVRDLVDEMNLPALLLSISTLPPMARARLHLFQTIVRAYPDLTQASARQSAERRRVLLKQEDMDEDAVLSTLVDPLSMETLSLQNARSARLDVSFAIRFNHWGHARPDVSVTPHLPTSIDPSMTAQEILGQIPAGFNHLCAHLSSPDNVSTALVSTIQAFFGLD